MHHGIGLNKSAEKAFPAGRAHSILGTNVHNFDLYSEFSKKHNFLMADMKNFNTSVVPRPYTDLENCFVRMGAPLKGKSVLQNNNHSCKEEKILTL
jgi:hypothetical protein